MAELEQRLQAVAACFPQVTFAPSLAVEDVVITDTICRLKLPLRIIAPNTDKLNPETEALTAATEARHQTWLEVFAPDKEAIAALEREFGIIVMYGSVELKRHCRHIRKIKPLNRALKNTPAWLTGQRRSRSDIRSELNFKEPDRSRNISKFSPIFGWEENDAWAYIEVYGVPLNKLYHQGYPSIGCEPYTRPAKEGENIHAGRW